MQRRAPPVACDLLSGTAPCRRRERAAFTADSGLPLLLPVSPCLSVLAQIRREQFLFFLRQHALAKQIGPPLPRPTQRLLQAPRADLRVVSRQQYVGDAHAAVLLGPRIGR